MRQQEEKSEVYSFERVLKEELKEIDSLREARIGTPKAPNSDADPADKGCYRAAHGKHLVGLAFSGGGIRSATFNLGILQGLAGFKLLHLFDYLSTVSGGGYIGSWLAAWINRESVSAVQEGLCAKTETGSQFEERRPLMFLRRYSNYLTPRLGMLSGDTWSVLSTYLRNLSLNLMIYLPFLLAVLLFPLIVVGIFKRILGYPGVSANVFFSVAVALLGIAGFFISRNLGYRSTPDKEPPWFTKQKHIMWVIVLPVVASAFVGSLSMWFYRDSYAPHWWGYGLAAGVLYLLSWLIGWFWCGADEKGWTRCSPSQGPPTGNVLPARGKGLCVLCMLASGVLWLVLLAIASRSLGMLNPNDQSNIWYVVTLGGPFIILVYMSVTTLQIGLLGRDFPDEKREWWSRLGGWLFIVTFVWVGLFGTVLLGPPLLVWVKRIGVSVIGTGWIVSTISGLLAGRSSATGGATPDKRLDLVAKAAPYVFIFGLLLFSSLILSHICISMSGRWDDYQETLWNAEITFKGLLDINAVFLTEYVKFLDFIKVFAVCLGIVFLLSWRVDINQFSMNLLYRNRLVRCYLGASNQSRNPQPFTGFDPTDDLGLHDLLHSKGYTGPYPLINTTLNLVGGRELAWQKRRATSFIFTPKFSGYEIARSTRSSEEKGRTRYISSPLSSYQPTSDSSGGRGVEVGQAISISGAAASPNMGYHTSKPLAFLMTIFNVRLGWWCGNPRQANTWRTTGTPLGLWYLLAELFGLTHAESGFVYLSDGGHFENLGVYELVRRRCRVIIACDASCDPGGTFEDLANALRKIRVDFGIRIDIDISGLQNDSSDKKHCAIGAIRYREIDGDEAHDGTLVYIKPVLCPGEPVDVLNYARTHSAFPHQTTADQWFDETQFESYRMLGLHSLQAVCGENWNGKTIDDFIERVNVYLKRSRDIPGVAG